MLGLPDSDVFREALQGDSSAIRSLLGGYRPLLRLVAARHARKVVSYRFDESDVVQVTLVEAFQGFEGFRGESKAELTAWLERILERSLVRIWRRHAATRRDYRREIATDPRASGLSFAWGVDHQDDPAQNLIRGEVAVLLAQALEKLPEEYRVTLELRFIDGQRIRDVAEQLDASVGVIAGRLRRGLEMLRELLPSELQDLMREGSE
jgi:RNA polymerase sigma-70 factor (ECF subfamily)